MTTSCICRRTQKEILKAKQVWPVVRADEAASLSSSHQVQASDRRSDVARESEYAGDSACSTLLQGLGKVLSKCVMLY